MKKSILIAAILGLSGCTTMSNLTPCEKAILAKYAAEKILVQVCPLSEPPAESTEGVY